MLVGWTCMRTLTPVLMKLSGSPRLLSTTFLITGAKVPQKRKLKSTKVVCGAKVPGVLKFHGAKVLGAFAPEERKFQGCESSMERKFLDFSLPRNECSTERKFHGSDSSLYGLFAPGNESAEKRKVRIPRFRRRTIPVIIG